MKTNNVVTARNFIVKRMDDNQIAIGYISKSGSSTIEQLTVNEIAEKQGWEATESMIDLEDDYGQVHSAKIFYMKDLSFREIFHLLANS